MQPQKTENDQLILGGDTFRISWSFSVCFYGCHDKAFYRHSFLIHEIFAPVLHLIYRTKNKYFLYMYVLFCRNQNF